MDFTNFQTIANLVFLVVIALLAIASLLSSYIFIKYGRTKSITMLISLIFAAVFVLQTIAAFTILQQLK